MSVPGSLFIDGTGQDARSGRVLCVLDPFNGSLVLEHDAATPGDVDRAALLDQALLHGCDVVGRGDGSQEPAGVRRTRSRERPG